MIQNVSYIKLVCLYRKKIDFHFNIAHVYRISNLKSKHLFINSYIVFLVINHITLTICRSIYRGNSFGFLAYDLADEKCENSHVDESFREWEGILYININDLF